MLHTKKKKKQLLASLSRQKGETESGISASVAQFQNGDTACDSHGIYDAFTRQVHHDNG